MTEVQWKDTFSQYIKFMWKLGSNIWAEHWEFYFKFFYDIIKLFLVF